MISEDGLCSKNTCLHKTCPQFPPIIMAKPKKTAAGTYRIQIDVKGRRDAATFPTARECNEWAAHRRVELLAAAAGGKAGARILGESKTLNDAVLRYKEEVSPSKRGWRWEFLRIDAFLRQPKWPGDRPMSELDEQDLIGWKNERRKAVKDGTVIREMGLLSSILEEARREWHWIERNPMADVKRPSSPMNRERVISDFEVRCMLRAMSWSSDGPMTQKKHVVARCFIHALLTGMRAGEIANLRWEDVRPSHCILRQGKTKTGQGRIVPLSKSAGRNIESMRGYDSEFVFGIGEGTLDVIFRRCRERAGLSGFTFHDSRHTAATRIAQKLHLLDLCKMFGWSDPKRAMTYYNPTAEQIADRLDAPIPGAGAGSPNPSPLRAATSHPSQAWA